ncbi:MAG: CPBP family intramembrane metalloprotease [Cyanobacteria bacterium SZAS TMP-1]|nr:CPBP family intramembrane metalloprotease [Cyanobacteria bacterium SZAS TMP-1]
MSSAPGNFQEGEPTEIAKPLSVTQIFKSDRAMPLLALLAVIGFVLYLVMEPKVFPSASIDLKLSRAQIVEMSRACADKFGYKRGEGPKAAIESTTFTYSDTPKTFLEHELGAVRANELMKEKIPIWSWTTRYCKEYQIEQMRVWLSPQGKMTAFERSFEDERAMPSISHEAAKKMAADFLAREAGVDVKDFKLVSDNSITMAKRDDHSFNWEDQREDFKGGYLQYFVYIAGDTVTTYSKTLHVPEKWTRQYSQLRTVNNLLEQIASVFYEPLQFLAYLAVPLALSRGLMRFRVAIFGGILMAVIAGVDSLNDFSSVVDSYNPTTSFRDYLTTYYVTQLFSALGTFISGACLFGGADVVYRMAYPKRVALENYLSFKGFKTSEGLKAVVVGYCVCAIHLGWIIAYYLLGDKLGFWCPLGLDAYQTLGTAFPFFSAISLGVHASWQEETAARVVGLALMQKLTGRFWIANLFQAAAWGFMHSTYPQQPAYARGIELTIGGLFYGWILRRYGLIPCLIGHYMVDAFLDVKPLFNAQSPVLFGSAFIPIVPIALLFVAACVMVKGKVSADHTAITNGELPRPEPQESTVASEEEPFHYEGLSKKTRWICALIGTTLMGLVIWSHVPCPGDDKHLNCSQAQAIEKGKAVLDAHGIDAKAYRVSSKLGTSLASHQLQYVFEKAGRARTQELASFVEPGYLWQVRFFRILDPREFTVDILGDGHEYSTYVTEEEDAPGKRLSREEARAKAVEYVHRLRPNYKDIVVDKVSVESRKQRDDWTVNFSVPSLKVGDADFRMSVDVIGDWPCNFSQGWKIPDAWEQERNKETGEDLIKTLLADLFWVVASIAAMIMVYQVFRAGRLPWKVGIFVGLACGALILCEQLNHLPSLYVGYETDKDRNTFLFQHGLEVLSTTVTTVLTTMVVSAFVLALYRRLKPPASVPAILVTALRPPNRAAKLVQEKLWIDGIIVGLLWAAIVLTKGEISAWLHYWFSPELSTAQIFIIDSLPDFWEPVASDLLELFTSFLWLAAYLLMVASLLHKYAPSFKKYFIVMALYVLCTSADTKHLSDYLISVSTEITTNTALWFVIARLARFNPIVYITKIIIDDSLLFIYGIAVYSWPIFSANLISFSFYLLAPIFVLCYVHVRNRTEKEKAEPIQIAKE